MKQFSRTIPVLPVRDIEAACTWYAKALGLVTTYRHQGTHAGERTNYAVLMRDGVEIHLILDEPAPYANTWTKAGTGYLYLRVKDVESVCEEVQATGIKLESGLETASWGAKGFEFRDPDGNLLRIEQEKVTEGNP